MCIKIEMCILRVKVLNSQISRQQLLGIQHESRVKALIPRVHWATAVQPLQGETAPHSASSCVTVPSRGV